jgi:ankyrin repeat protein
MLRTRKLPYLTFVAALLFAPLSSGLYAQVKNGQGNAITQDLYLSVQFQDIPKITEWISKGADVNTVENGRPLLGWAAQNGNPEVVELLLKAGANPNISDSDDLKQTPLMRAVETQKLNIVQLLLNYKANPNAEDSYGVTALTMAIQSSRTDIVEALAAGGADVKKVSPDGESAILTAVQTSMPEAAEKVKILAKAGAPLNVSNSSYTPLVYAVQKDNKELVQALLDAGADPDAKTSSDQAPIQSAAYNPEIMEILLKAKANPNTENYGGQSMLFEAIQNNRPDIAKLLIQAGADINKPDYSGTSPADMADRYGLTEIADIIRSKAQ